MLCSSFTPPVSGGITTWASLRARWPKYHLDPACVGLEPVPEEARGTQRFASLLALAKVSDTELRGRPCRMCALETVLAHAWARPSMQAGPQVAVTFSSQGNPYEPMTWNAEYEWGTVTESGAARLQRLAAHCGLEVVETAVGPVAHGVLPRRFARVLAANLRLYEVGELAASPEQIMVFWSLATDAHDGCAPADAADAWRVARATVA